MSEARIETTENLATEAAAGTAHGRHRGPSADDAPVATAGGTGHGRHRRPTPVQEAAAAQ